MFDLSRTLLLLVTVTAFAVSALGWGPFVVAESENKDAIRWKAGKVVIAISSSMAESAPNIKYGSDVRGAIERSIAWWRPYVDLEIVTEPNAAQNVSARGKSGDGINLITIAPTQQNTYFFSRDSLTSAKTRIFFSNRTQITEADIVLNPAQQFSTDGTFGTFDLETVLRHEIGHLLGLEHSSVAGAVMYDKIPRNGISPIVGQLSLTDIAAIRQLYGSSDIDQDCCGSIEGKITLPSKFIGALEIWATNAEDGSVAGTATLGKNRTFKVGGLPSGKYRLHARATEINTGLSQRELGEFIVRKYAVTRANSKFIAKPILSNIVAIGANGVISDQAVTVKRDSSSFLLLAGSSLFDSRFRIEIESPFISIDENSLTPIDYADDVDAVGLRISVSPDTPAGNYSVCVVDAEGARNCLLGSLRVTD